MGIEITLIINTTRIWGDVPKVETHSHSSLLVTPQPDVQSQCHSSASSSLSSSAGVLSATVEGMIESAIY